MQAAKFDDRNIPWQKLEGFDDVFFFIYLIDEMTRIVDVIYKFFPGARQPLHRHKCPYFTFVLQGGLRFYRPNGELREIRPVGSYVNGVANGEPHFEGAGDREAIVFFGHRGIDDALYEFIDGNGQQTQVLGMSDFKALLDGQNAAGARIEIARFPA